MKEKSPWVSSSHLCPLLPGEPSLVARSALGSPEPSEGEWPLLTDCVVWQILYPGTATAEGGPGEAGLSRGSSRRLDACLWVHITGSWEARNRLPPSPTGSPDAVGFMSVAVSGRMVRRGSWKDSRCSSS